MMRERERKKRRSLSRPTKVNTAPWFPDTREIWTNVFSRDARSRKLHDIRLSGHAKRPASDTTACRTRRPGRHATRARPAGRVALHQARSTHTTRMPAKASRPRDAAIRRRRGRHRRPSIPTERGGRQPGSACPRPPSVPTPTGPPPLGRAPAPPPTTTRPAP